MHDLNGSDQTMVPEQLLFELDGFVRRGGPAEHEYDVLSALFDKLHGFAKVRRGDKIDRPAGGGGVFNVFGPFNTTDTNQGFVHTCPRGYYGDFEIIERIYERRTSSDPALRRWDQYFNWTTPVRAVRARKDYCIELFDKTVRSRQAPTRILNVASGPCRDIYEFLTSADDDILRHTSIHCVDQDVHAIRYAQALLAPFADRVSFENRNIFRCRLADAYDLIWSAGLFDYLEDRIFIRLLVKLWTAVAPGGELVVGNFSTRNPHRSYMELAGWHLIHRDENDLLDLARQAELEGASAHVDQEPNGVNLFMHLTRSA
jgi:extracellular factor (EF) 3-hydroxypalmitic acid methyl ester biosynthesis protein